MQKPVEYTANEFWRQYEIINKGGKPRPVRLKGTVENMSYGQTLWTNLS